jgi:hypothetical protein
MVTNVIKVLKDEFFIDVVDRKFLVRVRHSLRLLKIHKKLFGKTLTVIPPIIV